MEPNEQPNEAEKRVDLLADVTQKIWDIMDDDNIELTMREEMAVVCVVVSDIAYRINGCTASGFMALLEDAVKIGVRHGIEERRGRYEKERSEANG